MGFLQPLALLGLAAASIPLILHFWRQRLPPLVNFPAVRYLTETTRQHSRTLKLHHLLLLILRTLLIVAVVMAAARPVVQRRVPGMSGLHPPTAIVLLLDNSLSAQTVRGGVPAIETFRRLAGGLFDDPLVLLIVQELPEGPGLELRRQLLVIPGRGGELR